MGISHRPEYARNSLLCRLVCACGKTIPDKELKMEYYKLKEDEKWLDSGDSPSEIGGRATDLEMIAHSLEMTVKSYFPVNGVPEEIAKVLSQLKVTLRTAEVLIDTAIRTVSQVIHELEE